MLALKELRKKAGLRQEDVANRLNVDQSAVSHWETGVFKPSRKYHKALADLYRCKVDELFEEK